MAPLPTKPLRPQVPPGLAPKALVKALVTYGPPVLRTKLVHGKTSEARLQMIADLEHAGDHDPHREGRAVDIVLLASDPTQKAEADELVRLFRRMVDVMEWGWLIYNKKQWSPEGAETPRIFRPMKEGEDKTKYAGKKAKHEHITHIHIEWANHKKDQNGFYDALVAELTSTEGALLNDMDAVPAMLDGTWNANIGDGGWTGIFKFTRSGGVSWASSPTAKPGGRGFWTINSNRILSWRFGGGDIRTFVTDLPLNSAKTDGQILPEGQGWFSLSKRP